MHSRRNFLYVAIKKVINDRHTRIRAEITSLTLADSIVGASVAEGWLVDLVSSIVTVLLASAYPSINVTVFRTLLFVCHNQVCVCIYIWVIWKGEKKDATLVKIMSKDRRV